MTREQRADALLVMARLWQNNKAAGWAEYDHEANIQRGKIWAWISGGKLDGQIPDLPAARRAVASLVLSEVGHEDLGFDIEGAEVWDREAKIWREQ